MTMHRHMFVNMLIASLIVTAAVSGILTLAVLFTKAPPAVLYSKTIFPLALGAITVNFSNVLPIGVAIAATWYNTNLIADRTIDVLYATGVSYFSVILPALVLGLSAATIGFYLSHVEAPRGWGRVLDAMYIGAHDIDASKLEPERFYNQDGRTLYFSRWLTSDEIEGVFIQERTDKDGERSISAPIGVLVRTPSTTLLHLGDVVVQTRKPGEQVPTIVNFNRLWVDAGLRGSSTPVRNLKYLAELEPVAFAEAYNQGDERYRSEWMIEAFKRTLPPVLAVIYLLVGVRLALLGLGARQEKPWKFYALCVGFIVHHALLLMTADALIGLDRRLAWAIVALVAIEICVAVAMNAVPFQLGTLRKSGEGSPVNSSLTPEKLPTEQAS